MDTIRAYWQFWPPTNCHHHQPQDQIAIPRKTRWCHNGANWSSITNEVEPKMQQLLEEVSISIHISRFNNILSAASLHISKTIPSQKQKPWINPHICGKIRNQNCLHCNIHQNQQEWIKACWEENNAINETKANSWKDLLHISMLNADDPDMWKVIQGLNGTHNTNSLNEAMSHNNCASPIPQCIATYSSFCHKATELSSILPEGLKHHWNIPVSSMASFSVLHQLSLFHYSRNLWPQRSIHT